MTTEPEKIKNAKRYSYNERIPTSFNNVLVVQSGVVYVYSGSSIVSIVGSGGIIDPQYALTGVKSDISVMTATTADIEFHFGGDFLTADQTAWAYKSLASQASFMRSMLKLQRADVYDRVFSVLQHLSERPEAITHPLGMQFYVTRCALCDIVGCSREMVGRVIKQMVVKGIISASGKTFVMHRIDDAPVAA